MAESSPKSRGEHKKVCLKPLPVPRYKCLAASNSIYHTPCRQICLNLRREEVEIGCRADSHAFTPQKKIHEAILGERKKTPHFELESQTDGQLCLHHIKDSDAFGCQNGSRLTRIPIHTLPYAKPVTDGFFLWILPNVPTMQPSYQQHTPAAAASSKKDMFKYWDFVSE